MPLAYLNWVRAAEANVEESLKDEELINMKLEYRYQIIASLAVRLKQAGQKKIQHISAWVM